MEDTNVNVNNAEQTATQSATQSATQEQTARTYTEEEVMKLIQSEADKRVTQAVDTLTKKHKQELSLSKLDDNAREKAEAQNRIAELEEKLAAFEIEKNKSELKSVLAARGLSAVFADIIKVTDNLEESQKNIDILDKEFKAAVTAEVEKRLAGSAPKGNTGATAEMTKENAKKLSLADMNELAQKDPDKFKSLFG